MTGTASITTGRTDVLRNFFQVGRFAKFTGVWRPFNGFVVGTGNKSEIAIGYYTKYGDGGVDLEPIGDLYKTEVFELAKFLEIPQKIIDKKPSAGLWEGQTDENEIGYTYEDLDSALKGELNFRERYDNLERLVRNSEHKRHMPPVFKIQR